jgi:hypothetical protein
MPYPFLPITEPLPHGSTKILLRNVDLALHADAIETHKWILSERLGRDVGLHVAAIDYFENVHPRNPRARVVERLKHYAGQVLSHLLTQPYIESSASLTRFEQAMHGTRSLAR